MRAVLLLCVWLATFASPARAQDAEGAARSSAPTVVESAEVPQPNRVYVAKLRTAADGVDDATANALEDRILVAARKARPDLTVIGRSDVATLADVDAERNAVGCETDSCAAEIADALGAPQIVTGQLARVGSTWILSLSRLERKTLTVVERDSIEGQGETAEVLIPRIPALVARILDVNIEDPGARPPAQAQAGSGALFVGLGGASLATGVLAGAAGGGSLVYASMLYSEAQDAARRGDDALVAEKRAVGEPATYVGWGLVAVGVVGVGVGAALLVVGLTE